MNHRTTLRSKAWGLGCAVGVALAILLPVPALAQSGNGFLTPIGPVAEFQRTELIWATVLILVAVLPVLVGTPWILWRYRRGNTKAKYRPQWHFDTKLEILMWGGPTLIVVLLSVWLAQAVFRIDPYRAIGDELAESMEFEIEGAPVAIQVVGLDWKWLYIYPGAGVASVGELVIPVGRPVSMRLTTDTVMQSYMAPGLAGQIYAMAGMVTQHHMIASRPGETLAENTQYNGPGFPDQRGPVRAVPYETYTAWIEEARAAPPLDQETYAVLAQQGNLAATRDHLDRAGEGPLLFSLADSSLFERIVGRYHTGEPIPREAQPGSPFYTPEGGLLPSLAQIYPDAFCGPDATRLAAASIPET